MGQLKIEFYNSISSYPHCNSQVEATNKTFINEINTRLEKTKAQWVKELPNVLWVYWITSLKATNETPYALAFIFKVIILLEVCLPTI